MKRIRLNNSDEEKHICASKHEGEWIVYKCTHADCDYERRFNTKTGKMVFKGTQTEILHKGEHFPTGINPENLTMN